MDILTIAALDAWIDDASRKAATITGLDILSRKRELAAIDLAGCSLIGCGLDGDVFYQAQSQGASIVTAMRDIPFNPARAELYAIEDLYDHYDPADSLASWQRSFDHANFRWFMDEANQLPEKLDTGHSIQARLHDTAIEAGVGRFIHDLARPVVGFMGGHDTPRDAPVFETVAHLARRLAREKLLVLTGGGPGLMEAANLGAFLAAYPDEALEEALVDLRLAPKYTHPDWLSVGWMVRARLLGGGTYDPQSINLGIPTWLYGHEPPNVFATHQAKMFYNSLREDGLVTLAGAGLIIGPGNAGTVQEIFQDATQNYYRKAGVAPTPIALIGKSFWERPANQGADPAGRTKPLRPLLDALAKEKPATDWSGAICYTDDMDEVANLILSSLPKTGAPTTKGEHWRAKQ